MDATKDDIDAIIAREAIRRLVHGACRALDRGDRDLLASVFWPDATVISGAMNVSAPDYAESVIGFVTANLEYCFHAVSNDWIEVNGDSAVGEHYITAQISVGGNDVTTGGRYLDSYQRRDGIWKISARTFVADWNTSQHKSLELDSVYEHGKTRGSFGKDDPVYTLWGSL